MTYHNGTVPALSIEFSVLLVDRLQRQLEEDIGEFEFHAAYIHHTKP